MLLCVASRSRLPLATQSLASLRRDICSTSVLSTKAEKPPVLRFAPSPTGHLHLGGLRTALFNHLFARKYGGRWILRIEDTDKKRLVPGAVEAMQETLRWAGLHYDEGPDISGRDDTRWPYVQSERLHVYRQYVDRLLASGHAYRDFRAASLVAATTEVNGEQTTFRKIKDDYLIPDDDEAQSLVEQGRPFVVRMKMPARDTTLMDAVYGSLRFPCDRDHDDPILVKSDGWPTYHLANVVDDTEMGITHVLRGEEWLPSVPLHLALYDALDLMPPQFAHLPLLINPDGTKLSKRHADVHVHAYRQAGYEPEALLNFVALMGHNWHGSDLRGESSGPDTANTSNSAGEVFTMNDLISGFEITRVSQSRACPNVAKLQFLNRQHLSIKAQSTDKEGREALMSRLFRLMEENESKSESERVPTEELSSYQRHMIGEVILSRSQTLNEAASEVRTLFAPIRYDNDETRSFWNSIEPDLRDIALRDVHEKFASVDAEENYSVEHLEDWLKNAAKTFERDAALVYPHLPKKRRGRSVYLQAVRFALTGKPMGPRVAEAMTLLGKQQCLERMDQARQWSALETLQTA